jgi:ABC-type Na+ transport system ATPase subunit NatA
LRRGSGLCGASGRGQAKSTREAYGADKSTTLRMLVSLTRPTAGHATVLGAPYAELGNPGRSVGVLLDASAQPG